MIENLIKAATCRISCGDESGTGWLIGTDQVVTARHCVLAGIESGKPVELFFPDSGDVAVVGEIIAQSEDWDTCLLSLEATSAAKPLSISLELPREGETWQAFGYPGSKPSIGHRLTGTVAQALNAPILKIDIDLSVDPATVLQSYRGMSGATVVCEGAVVGMMRLKVDGTIAALSLSQLEGFLTENDVNLPSILPAPPAPSLATRGDFPETFAEAVLARAGNYLFLEGAHGFGKTTFCGNFRTDEKKLINLGAYCLSDPNSALGANYRAQPQVFLEWLTTAIAGRITGQPPRKEEKSYPEQIRQTSEYLNEFSKYCAQSGRQGMFFVDGLNEIPGEEMLGELVGMLPAKLPSHVTVVLTAPNFGNIAVPLAGKVKTNDVFNLPPLPDEACYLYCQKELKPKRRSPALGGRICEKAKGHPLYLRYMIEYANLQETDDDLEDFPVLTGPIEEYYQGIWAKLLPDGDAVNLLALMARLRWGLLSVEFAKALNAAEQAQFVSVMSRIRHLLADEESTSIYHSSFATFIIEQTERVGEFAYSRLAKFCLEEPGVRYCALNRVFHLARAVDNAVFAECNQTWFDIAVTLGVEPDALIADVDAVVKRAALEAPPDEFFRLTLLAQRISFRYDTLFAQSARLIAEALIVLGRPSEALQHVLRLKALIVGPDDALEIAFLLHKHEYDEDALALLEHVQQRIIENYDEPMQLGEFLRLCSLHIQTVFLMRLAGGWNGMDQVMALMGIAQQACDEEMQADPLNRDVFVSPILAMSPTYFLTFRDEYADLARLKAFQETSGMPHVEPPSHYFRTQCLALLDFENTVDNYHLSKDRKALAQLFADLAELAPVAEIDASLAGVIADTLVRFGAPADVVELFSEKSGKQSARPFQIKAENGVDVNHWDLQECICDWRVAAFLDSTFRGPSAGIIAGTGWFESIEHLVGALFCCDGQARRAKADCDEEHRRSCRDQLKTQVIEPLRYTLHERATWDNSCAIPENVFPWIYRQLAELLIDCFPEYLPEWLDNLVESAGDQWGMYSEGFRASACQVLEQLTRREPGENLAPRLLALLNAWRDHVLGGVENRHELVPEILRMIPFYSHLGAKEEAERLYQHLLSVSMGPTWYKEDQLGIMTEVLGSVSFSNELSKRLPQVAGCLEKASGEMTFQRYVRAEKSSLIGKMARHGRYHAALAYFRRQCCGSTIELWAEAQQGPVDKIGPLKGNRFPGGALEEQASILALVRNSGAVLWELRWALLEIFHCGDSRHIDDYAKAFAKIGNEVGAVPELVRRAEIVASAETPKEERTSFMLAFRNELNPELHTDFATMLAGLPPVKSQEPPAPQVNNEADDDAYNIIFTPGIFGQKTAMRDADVILEEAEKQLALGNCNVAKTLAAKVLQTAQEGGWGIWGDLSDGTRRAKEILVQDEESAASVIRYYAPLIAAECYAPKWRPAEHLIGRVGPLLSEEEGTRLLDVVIDHCQLMVGNSTQETQAFDFLAEDVLDQNAEVEFFQFIVWLCDHPQWLRQDRAAVMLLWLVEQCLDLFPAAVTCAFSMDEGYGPDVLCGVLDGMSSREPLVVWDKIVEVIDLSAVTQELRHISRMVVLERVATRAGKAGSSSAKTAMVLIKESFIGKRGAGDDPELPPWANCLASEWRKIVNLLNAESVVAWEKELEQLCSPLSPTDMLALETAVAISFREGHERPFNRWESKLRHAINTALWALVSHDGASKVEAALRIYNPSQPGRIVQGRSNPITDKLMSAIKSGDYSSVLGSNSIVLLDYHDVAVKPSRDGMCYVEVLCLLQPTSSLGQAFGPQLDQSFRSSEFPEISTVTTPFETCCRIEPETVFFDTFTPSVPLPFFQNLAGVKDDDFIRQTWRFGRRNEGRGFGRPEREGCSLSVPRKALKIPGGLKLVWIVWVDGEVVTVVDEHNDRLI